MKRILLSRFLIPLFALLVVGASTQSFADEPEKVPTVKGRVVLGYVEHILVGNGLEFEALLSPSHHSSELGVGKMKITKDSKGDRIATFDLRDKKGRTQTFSLKILEEKSSTTKKNGKSVVVRLPICLGNYELTPQFRLVDRSHFAEPVRLGRRILAGRVIIDPSMTHAAAPSCEGMKPAKKKKTSSKEKK